MIEAGVPGYVAETWGGLSVVADTPKELAAKLHADVVSVLKDPDMRTRMQKIGAEPVPQTPQQYGDFMRAEMVKWHAVVKRSNITMQ